MGVGVLFRTVTWDPCSRSSFTFYMWILSRSAGALADEKAWRMVQGLQASCGRQCISFPSIHIPLFRTLTQIQSCWEVLSLAETPSGHSEVLLKGSKDVCRLLTSLQRFPVDKTPSTVRVSIRGNPRPVKSKIVRGDTCAYILCWQRAYWETLVSSIKALSHAHMTHTEAENKRQIQRLMSDCLLVRYNCILPFLLSHSVISSRLFHLEFVTTIPKDA